MNKSTCAGRCRQSAKAGCTSKQADHGDRQRVSDEVAQNNGMVWATNPLKRLRKDGHCSIQNLLRFCFFIRHEFSIPLWTARGGPHMEKISEWELLSNVRNDLQIKT